MGIAKVSHGAASQICMWGDELLDNEHPYNKHTQEIPFAYVLNMYL